MRRCGETRRAAQHEPRAGKCSVDNAPTTAAGRDQADGRFWFGLAETACADVVPSGRDIMQKHDLRLARANDGLTRFHMHTASSAEVRLS